MEFRNDFQLSFRGGNGAKCLWFSLLIKHIMLNISISMFTQSQSSANWTEFCLTWCLYRCMLFLLFYTDFTLLFNAYRAIMFLCTGGPTSFISRSYALSATISLCQMKRWHVKHRSHMTDTQNFSLPSEKPEISSNYKIDRCKLEATSISFHTCMHMRTNVYVCVCVCLSTLKDVRIITNLNTWYTQKIYIRLISRKI